MEPLICRLAVRTEVGATTVAASWRASTRRRLVPDSSFEPWRVAPATPSSIRRPLSSASRVYLSERTREASRPSETAEEDEHFARVEAESTERQMRAPWMREGAEQPPVARRRSAGAMTKGKLLTTPSRMLKLILPLTTRDVNKDRKDVEPLALLVHPHQPLSYLERLVQSELPMVKDSRRGGERPPQVAFKADDNTEEDIGSGKPAAENVRAKEEQNEQAGENAMGGTRETTGSHQHSNFVRWSPSTEIGDFIRDAARGKEFAVEIEGAPSPIYVAVPSFEDRTYYLRMRLRKTAKRILELADIKQECDRLAQKGARRVAQGGFAGLVGWWALVYYLTFKTDLGWDVMEPVTYLVGLTGLMGGYMWFLYHNREVSYRSALNYTVSRRQSQLYEQKGFDLPVWERLVDEGNRLRHEIRVVAEEYDVEWDETKDAGDERVTQALRKERQKKEAERREEDDEDGDSGGGGDDNSNKKE